MSAKKINVLIEVSSFDKGGLEKVVLDSALYMDSEKFSFTIVSIGPVGLMGEYARDNGIDVIGLREGDPDTHLREIISSKRIDISASHFSRFGYPIYQKCNIPNITYIHNVYAFLSGEALENFKSDDCYIQKYISVSPNATRYAVGKLGIKEAKIETIPNGLSIDEHTARYAGRNQRSRAEFGILDSDYLFLNVASYNLHKAHYLMVEAMQILLKKRKDIKILCVGNEIYAPHVSELRRYIVDNGLSEHILMPGHHPYVESFFAISDAFLLPSFIEGWSIAMNEAMFYEKPMILSNTGGSDVVIENEDIGIVVQNEYGDILNLESKLLDSLAYDIKNYESSGLLAAAMERFADNPEYWRKAGRLAREKLIKRYDIKIVAKHYEKVMTEVVSNLK